MRANEFSRWAIVLLAGAVGWLALGAGQAFAGFGLRNMETTFLDESGIAELQAGAHPAGASVNTSFAVKLDGTEVVPDGDVRDLSVTLPPGLVGNPTVTPRCTTKEFHTPSEKLADSGASCPDDTQVGVVEIQNEPGTPSLFLGVYNIVPPAGVPAEFGLNPLGSAIVLVPAVRPGGDYSIRVESKGIGQAIRLYGVKVTLWGVPAAAANDPYRGFCLVPFSGLQSSRCTESLENEPKALLRLPTHCGQELEATAAGDSWREPGVVAADGTPDLTDPHWGTAIAKSPALGGCSRLDFSPAVDVRADTAAADSPSGFEVKLNVPQSDNPVGLGEADLRKIVMTLPRGFAANPAAADGLQACSPEEIGLKVDRPVTCPEASKVGTVEIHTPLLEAPLEGSVYLAAQGDNPFGSLLALYLVVEGSGVLIKLAGEVQLDPVTGQMTTIFKDLPQQPIGEVDLKLFGGTRAALSSAPACGEQRAVSVLTPWSTETPAVRESVLRLDSGCGGGFAPSFVAGTASNSAGGFSPFSVTLSRADQDQALGGIRVQTPPGLLGMLSRVTLCGEPDAAAGTCPQASRIGSVKVGAGTGPTPVWVNGEAFLTGPYRGAPFGLSIVVPVKAGPFDLGLEKVRAAIGVDPHTAQIIIVSDPLPTIRDGIPLQVRSIHVDVDREGFMFNPTNCEPLAITGTVTSTQGASAAVSSRFAASNCGLLPFKPSFKASSQAKTSRADGASLDVKVGYPKGTEANIRKVAVSLPRQLPSRLTTIQKACPEATFAANPASCPVASNIGVAKAVTPVLNVPLTGPAYLVSHGGAAFPDLVMVLQGQGVTLDLVGSINISKKGITSSTFNSVPDAPIGSFELKLPVGPHSALTANLPAKAKHSLCSSKLKMPTTIVGQNGAVIKQATAIGISGCPRHKAKSSARRR